MPRDDGSGYYERAELLGTQIYGVVVAGGWAFFMTLLIGKIVDLCFGLKADNLDDAVEDKKEDAEVTVDGDEKCIIAQC
jgi:ammonia channel protein AmtB